MRNWLIIPLILALTSCSTLSNVIQGDSIATITESDDGRVWVIQAKSDALVEFSKDKDGTVTLKVDNRGSPSPISEALGAIMVISASKTNVKLDGD